MSHPPAPPSPPPPAYSEQEFDAKVATALQVSLHISQAKKPREEEEWEEWDEAAFEAAARAQERPASPSASSSGGSSSSRALPPPPPSNRNTASPPVIRPLNIHKKNRSSSSSVSSQPTSTSSRPSEKPRPSWYDEAGLGHQPTASPSTGFIVHNTTENDEDYSVPPPPFSPTGPSLDGPPFEEVEHRTPQPRPVVTMRPPSVAPVPVPQHDRHLRHVRTPPPPPPPLSPSPSHARMNFNPSVAYGKTRNPAPYPEAHQIQSIDAAAFYNSSVASHLTSAAPQRPHSMSPQRPPSIIGHSPQPPYKRATYMPAPVAPVPTYPNAAMRPRIPSAADLSNYTPSYANPNAYTGAQNARWATSEQQLSNFFQ